MKLGVFVLNKLNFQPQTSYIILLSFYFFNLPIFRPPHVLPEVLSPLARHFGCVSVLRPMAERDGQDYPLVGVQQRTYQALQRDRYESERWALFKNF